MENSTDRFVFLPSITGSGVLVRRDQLVGARPNGPNEGAVIYTEAGPSIYTALTTEQLAKVVDAQRIES